VSESPPVPPAGEVRVSDYVRRALRRWYVIVFAIVVAVLVVYLHGVSKASGQSTATASIYLGQPFSPGGSSVLSQTPLSNPTISISYVTAPQQIAAAARAAGIDRRNLRSHVTVTSAGGATTAAAKAAGGGGAPTISITVAGSWTRAKVQIVANSLAQALIGYANRYTALKSKLVSARVVTEKAQLAALQDVQRRAQANLTAIDASSEAPLSKVAAESPYVSDLATAAQQIGTLTENLTNDQVALVATRDIESAQFIARATGHKVGTTTRRSSLIIAAMVGLILGVALALAWEALAARPRVRTA
jgi:hypothetical protein